MRVVRRPSAWIRFPTQLAAVAAVLFSLIASTALPADGYQKLLSAQTKRAALAMRQGDYAAAEDAWRTLLEFDPVSTAGLNGMVEAARAREDRDAEALALHELITVWQSMVHGGDSHLERDLVKAKARRAEIDPHAGEAAELLEDYLEAIKELGAAYLADEMYANAMICWGRVAALVAPGSPDELKALEVIETCLREGGDHVVAIEVPRREIGGKDAAWILAHDKKTLKWNKAASRDTPHYRVKTNAGWRMLNAAAESMESVHAFYREIWGIVPDPPIGRPDPDLRDITVPSIDLYIYRDREEYLKRSGAPEWSGGVFKGSEVATFDYSGGADGESYRDSIKTLFHEASHQFMSVAVGNVPSFVNEGIACLFEGIDILPNGTIRRDLPVMNYLNDLDQRIRNGSFDSLADVMDPVKGNESDFYSPRWGLFYYLRMCVDDQGAYIYRDLLEDYIYEFKRGTPGNTVEHFENFFLIPTAGSTGVENFSEFESTWRKWILALKASLVEKDARVKEFRREARLSALKKQYDRALRFNDRVLDLEPDDVDALHGAASMSDKLELIDRAVYMYRRFLEVAVEDEKRRPDVSKRIAVLDPHSVSWDDARRSLVGGMAALAQRYDKAEMPLMAMRVGHDVLELDAFDASSRALVDRLERETGMSIIRWERLFNGFDMDGWRSPGGKGPFYVTKDGRLESDYSNVFDADRATGEAAGVSLYRNLFLERPVQGNWSLEARISADRAWEIAGLCFGVKDADHFEAIVLRKTGDGAIQNVDFGSFDGSWTFRGDGSYKAEYDIYDDEGVLLRVDIKGKEVFVTIDGEPLTVIVDGKERASIEYPAGALRGDVGLLSSRGVTSFRDLRLLAGKVR